MSNAAVSPDVLVPAIIAGIASEPPWGQFVDQLRTEFGANHANLIFRGVGSSQVYFAHASSPDIECFGDLTKRYDLVGDPIPYFEMEAFRPYQVEEFLAGGAALTHPFIRDFLRPLGMEKLLICRIKSAAGLQAWLSVTRRSEGFSANEQARLTAVSHQFALALDVFGRLKAAEEPMPGLCMPGLRAWQGSIRPAMSSMSMPRPRNGWTKAGSSGARQTGFALSNRVIGCGLTPRSPGF